MLNVLRKQAQSTLIQGLVLVIAIVFVFWGVGANMNNNRNSAATVNGEEITFQQFQRAYDRTVENFRQLFGGQVPPGLLEGMGIKQQVLGQLIQAELLRQGGEEMGIVVSDLVAQREIKKMAAFQQDGNFDLERYKAVLSQNRMTPTSFENGLKADLQTARVTDSVGSFAMVPDSAVKDWLAYTGEEIKLAYVSFDPAAFEKKVEVKDDELSAWFEKNQEKYRSEPKVRLEYLFFGFAEDGKKVELSDEELKDRYESDKATYQTPEQRHARHILFKVEKGDSDDVRAEKKKKAAEVLALARQGKDFAELARKYSEGPTKERGGDLGFFGRGRMVPSFDEVVFSMKAGDISEVVETPFGYHVIKLEEIRPATGRSFEQVKDNLAKSVRQEKARGLTFKRASKTYEEIMRAGSLEKYGQNGKEKVITTDYFSRSKPLDGVTAEPEFLAAAFGLNKGELSSVVELKDGYTVIFVNDIQEPALPELAAVRERVVADYTKEKAVDLAAQAAADLLAAGREKGGIKAAAGSEQQVLESDFLKRSAPAAAGAPPAQVLQDSFNLSWKDKLAPAPVQVGTTSYVYEIIERRPGGEEADAARLEQVREQLLAADRNALITSWLGRVRERAKIWTNSTLFQ
jgi:peptidyl-prolyl cis-trans isomerase D